MTLIDPSFCSQLEALAHDLADAARVTSLAHFRTAGLLAQNKDASGFDPVTVADRDTEAAMREILADRRPEDGIRGEEHADVLSQSGLTWVLDPIDGTRAYISGMPTWGVLISLADSSGPQLGIIDQPYIGERFVGGFGTAALMHGETRTPLRTRDCPQLRDAILFTTFPEIGSETERAAFEEVRNKIRMTRYGADCYAYALVALGQVDLVIEAGLNSYDIQAPIAVIEAAGGIVTDWQGGPAHEGGRVLAAGDRTLHARALEILSNY